MWKNGQPAAIGLVGHGELLPFRELVLDREGVTEAEAESRQRREGGDETITGGVVPTPLLAQEQLCSVSLVALATLLLWVRRAISLDQSAQRPTARLRRIARVFALLAAAICAAGLTVVVRLPSADMLSSTDKLPTVMATVLAIVFALNTYVGMAKLPR